VLKKHPYAKNLLFADVVLIRPDVTLETPRGSSSRESTNEIEFASLAIKRVVDEGADRPAKAFIAGDIIRIERGHIQNAQQSILDKTQRMSIFVKANDISVEEGWDMKKHEFFSFENNKIGVEKFGTDEGRIVLHPPRLAIQCKQHSVDRVISSLTGLCQRILTDGAVEVSQVRETSTCFVKSSDRLILVTQSDPLISSISQRDLIEKITKDPILSPAVMRIYLGRCKEALYGDCDVHLTKVLQRLDQSLLSDQLEIQDLRLHVYPKYLSTVILNSMQYSAWNPRQASHVLHVFLFDGVWSVSVAKNEDSFIGDLRDPNSTSNIDKLNKKDVEVKDEGDGTICRAQAKLKEVFTRNLSTWLDKLGSEYQFKLAIDIGASPGGWTSFMAGSGLCTSIISVDNGDVTIDEKHQDIAKHWRMQGQQALDLLTVIMNPASITGPVCDYYALMSTEEIESLSSQRIDLFCCDANIDPNITFSMFYAARDHQLLSRDGAVFVITCKNIFRKKEQWEMCLQQCLQRLQSDEDFCHVQMQHLLANTAKEVTISGIYLPIS
jgi:hypothetical protein